LSPADHAADAMMPGHTRRIKYCMCLVIGLGVVRPLREL
jgi:hypothetical protein